MHIVFNEPAPPDKLLNVEVCAQRLIEVVRTPPLPVFPFSLNAKIKKKQETKLPPAFFNFTFDKANVKVNLIFKKSNEPDNKASSPSASAQKPLARVA